MKKPTAKKPVTPVTPAKSPAPATSKTAAPAPAPKKIETKAPLAKAAAKPAAPAAPVKTATPAVPAKTAAAPSPIKKPAIPVDPVNPPATSSKATEAAFTVVTAQIDVGFGNTLYLRGEGPGLNWNKGLALKNAGATEWTISLPRATRPIVFKFLINDETWSTGADFKADPGALTVLTPEF